MSEIRRLDDLDDEEIRDIKEFYGDSKGLRAFKNADDLIRWLNE